MAEELFQAGGIEGMVGGQWLDLQAEGRSLTLAELTEVHRGKTGALIRASCTLGAIAGRGTDPRVAAITAFGDDIGLAFQIADDVLDCTATSEELGKTAGRDAALAKSTYVRLLGVDGARREAETLARRAVQHLDRGAVPSGALGTLAGYIVSRTS
jgi:farnesyl diphosphate synthase